MQPRMLAIIGAVALLAAGCSSTPEPASPPSGAIPSVGAPGIPFASRLDAEARAQAAYAEQRALETGAPGVPERWTAPTGDAYGEFVAGHPYEARGLRCRDFTRTVYLAGRPEVARGTACRQLDGSWKRVG